MEKNNICRHEWDNWGMKCVKCHLSCKDFMENKVYIIDDKTQFGFKNDHDHYARGNGSLVCPLCKERFDVPIIAIIKNDIVVDSNNNEAKKDVLPSRNQRTANINHDIRRSMGKRPGQADSNQRDSGRDETTGSSRHENNPSSQGISEKTIHPKSLRQIKPIVIRPTEERLA